MKKTGFAENKGLKLKLKFENSIFGFNCSPARMFNAFNNAVLITQTVNFFKTFAWLNS